jgi:TPR repeat protein
MKRKLSVVILVVISLVGGYAGIRTLISSIYGAAVMEMKKGHFEMAKPKLEWLAMLGHAQAQMDMGYIYAYGRGVTRDREKAIKWFKRSVENERLHQIDPIAQFAFFVGMDFAKGRRTKQDQTEADWWFNFAKKRGYARGSIGSLLNISPIFVAGDLAREDYGSYLSEQMGDDGIFEYFQEIENYRITLKEEKEYYFVKFDLVENNQKTLHESWAKYRINKNGLTIAERKFSK